VQKCKYNNINNYLCLYNLAKCWNSAPRAAFTLPFAILSRYRSAIEVIVLPGKNTA